MADDLSVLRAEPFADALTKLEGLMTQSGRAFLIGAGCSKCAGLPLTGELTSEILDGSELDEASRRILKGVRTQFDGATNPNIEDYLSEIVDLIAIAKRRAERGATKRAVELEGTSYDDKQLLDAAEKIKQAIANVIERKISVDTHWQFIQAVHRPLRPGKIMPDRPVDYVVLNYDTLIEDALALQKLPYSDGLEGGVTGWWNPTTFGQSGLAARVFKVHGSINWCELLDDPLPRRIPKGLNLPMVGERRILIWPASTKYRETQRDPYAQLAGRVRDILRPKDDSQEVLLICGYRFGESHINLEIDSALRESKGRLTVVAFSSEDRPAGQLKQWSEDLAVRDQVLIFANRGFFHSEQSETSTVDLPWWKFENVTRLLKGEG